MTTKRIYGKKTTRHTYTVTDETHEALKRIGGGNASRGLRMAVDLAECAEDLAFWLRQALLDIEDQETEDRACEALRMFEEVKQ